MEWLSAEHTENSQKWIQHHLVAGCSISHKPRPLRFSRWAKLSTFLPKMVSVISGRADVCSVWFSFVTLFYKNGMIDGWAPPAVESVWCVGGNSVLRWRDGIRTRWQRSCPGCFQASVIGPSLCFDWCVREMCVFVLFCYLLSSRCRRGFVWELLSSFGDSEKRFLLIG